MKNLIKQFLFVFVGALCLMTPAFWNGYPIVFADTGTYIATGFDSYNPIDRPPTYGLFVWLTSFKGVSLWFVIFSQCFILSALIFLFIQQFSNKHYLWKGIISVIFLSMFTGLAWVSSQIMADVTTSVALLCIIILLFGNTKRLVTITLCITFYLFSSMHGSHFLQFLIICIILFALNRRFLPRETYKKRWLRIPFIISLLVGTIPILLNSIRSSSHVIFMGAMDEQGILKEYLDEYCPTKHYKLCANKDSLPVNCSAYIWNSSINTWGKWDKTKDEDNEIIHATLTTPKYIWLHLTKSLQFTLRQMCLFSVGDGFIPNMEGFPAYYCIKTYFHKEFSAYTGAKQNLGEVRLLKPWNIIIDVVMILSLVFLAYLLLIKRSVFSVVFSSVSLMLLLGLLLSDWSCATFSCVVARFGCKSAWIVPFIALLALMRLFDTMKDAK